MPDARRHRRQAAIAAALTSVMFVSVAMAGDATSPPATTLPAGYRPHLADGPGGKIDWANGTLLVEGIGKARGTDDQQQKMAERAATVVAARNALRLAAGIQVDRYGRFSDLRDGTVQIEGMIKGHFAVDVDWDPTAVPPTCTITLGVPMWGIKGLAAIVFDEARSRARSSAHMPIVSSTSSSFSDDEYIVIDARGAKVRPCLFPLILDADNRVLYDASVRQQYHGDLLPTVRYVEISAQCTTVSAESGSEDDVAKTRRHFKAMTLNRTVKTDIYLGRGDVRTIANDATLAALLKAGRILVVLESESITTTQGAAPTSAGDEASSR